MYTSPKGAPFCSHSVQSRRALSPPLSTTTGPDAHHGEGDGAFGTRNAQLIRLEGRAAPLATPARETPWRG